jgi:3-dehydroquinate synthase
MREFKDDSRLVHQVLQEFRVTYTYPVLFTSNAFDEANPALAQVLRDSGCAADRIFPVIDDNVDLHHPDWWRNLSRYVAHWGGGELLPPLSVPGGEAAKASPGLLDQIYHLVADHRIDRQNIVLAIGGGAVLDAVGFAAATAHRGIRLIRMPTTVLAQNDAGIGVKNGLNFNGRKNFVGTFAPPLAVINDSSFLTSLSPRDKRAGMAEAVKVALIRDREFFYELLAHSKELARFESGPMLRMIRRCAELHLRQIATSGDPFEMGSARPLDYGHWSAHKLEELSRHRLRHGEAVAIGSALDALYSHRSGLLGASELNSVISLLMDLGFRLDDPSLGDLDIEQALAEFREHLGGDLCITLLTGAGRAVEVNDIDVPLMQACADALGNGSLLYQRDQAIV